LLRYRVAHRSAAARPGLTQVLDRIGKRSQRDTNQSSP
jgi:hypothetical protein